MFPDVDVTPCIFATGFVSRKVAYVPFKDDIDEAITAAIKAGSEQARNVARSDTSWVVRWVHLTFDDIGRMTHANTIRRAPRGYKVLKTLTKDAQKLLVRWPRWEVKKWLVNYGYKTSDTQIDRACTNDNCMNPSLTLYHGVSPGEFVCENCLAVRERLVEPAVMEPVAIVAEPAVTAPVASE